jgi:hypothetical protein
LIGEPPDDRIAREAAEQAETFTEASASGPTRLP